MDSFDLDTIRNAIQFISPECRDTWLQVGQGIKSEFGDVGFDLWDGWSAGSDNYKPADARAVWRSFRGAGVTIGTVIFLAKEGGWQPARIELSPIEKQNLAADMKARRAARTAEIEKDEAARLIMQKQVAAACADIFEYHCTRIGVSEYLKRKMVGHHGVKFTKYAVAMITDDKEKTVSVVVGPDVVKAYSRYPRPWPDHFSIRKISRGTLVIPMRDMRGVLWSIQTIAENGAKMFPKFSRKTGLFHAIGVRSDLLPLVIAEGYATAASLLRVYKCAVAVAFDAGNIVPVAEALRAKYPKQRMVICADNDSETPGNPGVTKAHEAAKKVGAVVVIPTFSQGVAA